MEMIGNPKGRYQTSINEYTIVESSQPKEIRIVMGINDQYVAKRP
jgi:hypothetical protein